MEKYTRYLEGGVSLPQPLLCEWVVTGGGDGGTP